jgi:diguanylate cyclase (GGDEF)-like protein
MDRTLPIGLLKDRTIQYQFVGVISMKRLILAFVVVFGWGAAVSAAAPAPLTTLRAIHALTNAEADQGLPVAFEATVTYYNGAIYTLFVQDGGAAIYVTPTRNAKLVPGDRILIRGKTHGSFRPVVLSDSISLLRHGDPPKPVPATFGELITGQDDCLLITVRGIVRAADRNQNVESDAVLLQVLTEGGYIVVIADHFTPAEREGLLDAEVEISGVAGGQFDGKYQMHGVQLSVSSPANVKILKPAGASIWSLPLTSMDQVISGYQVTDRTQRVRVHGTITYFQPGSSVVLQDGNKSLWIATRTQDPLRVGDVVDATGFPESQNGFLALTRGEIHDTYMHVPIAPLLTTIQDLTASRHVFDLVSVEAQVVSSARGAAQDEYDLDADGQLFSAIYHHPAGGGALSPMKEIPVGSRVRVNGICTTEDPNPFAAQVSFDILMRSFDDISVVASPSMLTIRNLIILVGLLVAVVFAVGARGWAIEYRVRRQTTALALIEQRRSRILEDINGSRPLAEVVEEITELVSFKLRGAPCWCQIFDGAQLGNCPPKLSGLRIIKYEIPAHTGPALGDIFAAFDPSARPNPNESEALSMAVALTALAIETRRLYSDLRHRSEFDLLTDIHNRFSIEKYLDRQIEEARQKAGIFGLIYIDLDKFKQVNDLYGHQFGDLYLQEVAKRMKRQLRNVDMLARLGGDEFAVLLPQVRNRARVEEIAQRLERSFEEVFIIEGQTLHGSASVGIAVYPEDGATRDGLLSAADDAMYLAKHGKAAISTVRGGPPNP